MSPLATFIWHAPNRLEECSLLLQGACEPRLFPCEEERTLFRGVGPLTQPDGPQHSCHWQLLGWPDDGGAMPSENTPFTPSSILFRPQWFPARRRGNGGGAGYCPRVRWVYYDGHLSP